MNYIILQFRNGIAKVFKTDALTYDNAMLDANSIHSEGSVEAVLGVDASKKLHIVLDEVLTYPTGTFTELDLDRTKCSGCGNQLGVVEQVVRYDLCPKCELVRMKLKSPGDDCLVRI